MKNKNNLKLFSKWNTDHLQGLEITMNVQDILPYPFLKIGCGAYDPFLYCTRRIRLSPEMFSNMFTDALPCFKDKHI